jgi:hypothetical protein
LIDLHSPFQAAGFLRRRRASMGVRGVMLRYAGAAATVLADLVS